MSPLRATLLAFAALLLPLEASLGASQTRSPAAAGNCTSLGGAGANWTNPGNAFSSNNSRATASVDGTTTDPLQCLNYGFTIPVTAIIQGIEVSLERRSSSTANGGSRDASLFLVKAGAQAGSNGATATIYTTADLVEVHGGPANLWGTTWTAAQINAANFGAVYTGTKPNAAGGAHTVSVDVISITVHYTSNPPPAPSLVSPADGATVTNPLPVFDWTDVVDPDGDAVTYDMQADDSGCAFASPEINQTGLAASTHTPGAALANGTYCWRARAVDAIGAVGPWSATRTVIVSAPVTISQTRSPGAAGNCTSLGGAGTNWSNPGNAFSSNNSYATANVDGTTTDPLRCLNYGFTIPLTAVIAGIEVSLERRSSSVANGGSRDASLFLVKAGTQTGNNGATATIYTTADVAEAHGGPGNLWGTTWTPAEINAANFGAVYTGTKPSGAGAAHTIRVDHIAITVHYYIPAVPPGSFNAFESSTAAAAINGVVRTKVAGAAFSLDVVAIQAGAQMGSFTDQVRVELLGNTALGVALDASNCPTSSTTLQTVSPTPTITGGRSTIAFAAVADAWRDVRVRIGWPAGAPTVVSCSTDNFALRPNTFAGFALSDTDWQTAGMTRALNSVAFAAVTHKAGRPLSASASAVNAAGAPAVTPNYVGTPAAALSACAGAACTAGFGTLTLGAAFAAGQLTSDVASYDNVGAFRVQLVDASFATVDAADGSTAAEREIRSAAIDVGRFVPDHFTVSLNTPQFGTSCGTFTYQGQSFIYSTAPVATVTARSFAGGAATLYAGSWWRITNASLPGTQATRYSAAGAVALDVAALPNESTDPVIAASGAGVGTLTFSSTGGIAFQRVAPVSPFAAEIALSIDVIDADGVAYAANPAKFGDASAGNGIAFSAGKTMRFGRLRLQNSYGPVTVGQVVPLETQYWNGTSFVRNTDDSCTTLNREHVALSSYTLSLNACETAAMPASVSFSGGQASLPIAAAGAGNTGRVLLTPILGSTSGQQYCPAKGGAEAAVTSASRAYLQARWTGVSWNEDPSARATFGLYGQARNFIFYRENY
jgi:MSHA biogenesis protein MshQ